MEKRTDTANTMMTEMCMWSCRMRMTCCAYISDMFSISEVNLCAA